MFKIQELIQFEDGTNLAASVTDWFEDHKLLTTHGIDYSKFYLDQSVLEDLSYFVDRMV